MALTLTEVSELGVGLVSLFGGLLKKIAPPERAAMIWTGIASLIAALMFLAVKILGLISSDSSSSKILWGGVALGSIVVSLIACWIYLLSSDTRTVPWADTSKKIIGTEYSAEAKQYRTDNNVNSDEQLLFEYGGKTSEVWTEASLKRSRRILGIEYAIFVACLAFGLNLSIEVINHKWKDAPPKPEPTFKELASTLKDVHFVYNRSDIGEDAIEKLDEDKTVLLKLFKRFPGAHVTIEGFGDDRGTDRYNLDLGYRRADQVKNELIQLGISPDRLATSSLGKGTHLCSQNDEECRGKNRRVHLAVNE
jgi:outer membrane protein OmpA-like peptidoglycan-associated protein